MAELISIYSKILTIALIILGIALLIGTIFTRLLIFKIILCADILFWITIIAIGIYLGIEIKMEEKKNQLIDIKNLSLFCFQFI